MPFLLTKELEYLDMRGTLYNIVALVYTGIAKLLAYFNVEGLEEGEGTIKSFHAACETTFKSFSWILGLFISVHS